MQRFHGTEIFSVQINRNWVRRRQEIHMLWNYWIWRHDVFQTLGPYGDMENSFLERITVAKIVSTGASEHHRYNCGHIKQAFPPPISTLPNCKHARIENCGTRHDKMCRTNCFFLNKTVLFDSAWVTEIARRQLVVLLLLAANEKYIGSPNELPAIDSLDASSRCLQ